MSISKPFQGTVTRMFRARENSCEVSGVGNAADTTERQQKLTLPICLELESVRERNVVLMKRRQCAWRVWCVCRQEKAQQPAE